MALIIWGTREYTCTEAGELEDCPLCRARASVVPIRSHYMCHLYFIPLIPCRAPLSLRKCRECKGRFAARPVPEPVPAHQLPTATSSSIKQQAEVPTGKVVDKGASDVALVTAPLLAETPSRDSPRPR